LTDESDVEVKRMRRDRPYVEFRPPNPPLPERFRIGGILGRGMGTEVFSAHDELLNKPVAVKLFPANPDPTECRRVADEARALDRLDHRRLVSVYDGGLHRGRPYLVMQLIRGESLAARLSGGPISAAEAVPLVALVADALTHVHLRGVVHRDVKPSNILLDRQGLPYLSDFGIALLSGLSRVTSVDEIIGTPAYLAPEQVYGGQLGPAAMARLERPPSIPADLPEPLIRLIRRMTELDPESRPTAQLCVEALSSLLYDLMAGRVPHPATPVTGSVGKHTLVSVVPGRPAPYRPRHAAN
jgi:serine/threonine protein kinase